jgi:hypothetical protein
MTLNVKMTESIIIRGEKIEEEPSFPYLGSNIVTRDNFGTEDITSRITKAVRIFKTLHHQLWKRKEISITTDGHIPWSYHSCLVVWIRDMDHIR